LEDKHDEGREEQRAEEAGCTKLPGQLSFSGPGECPLHNTYSVKGGEDIDDLENTVVEDLICAEEVGVS